ncbi:MAG: TolC family outer membrane protein [Wenzhouxiangellaceae bacterium]|nr:TolC family outer membrane protein [Wenzhouxiangellaceae bacterium]MBS3746509.1 TolC family outer membrane protein [Wenzhouxiangellaceae bacterium]MBS3822741.1 TolC family outer membrane protein [Wenzhouxiangellaceae bacterium]
MRKILATAIVAALSTPAAGVDLMGVYELASTNDPEIRAAERRLDASEIETKLARANFLPQIDATLQRTPIGSSQPKVNAVELDENDVDSENYRLDLTQSLYDHSNFVEMERARLVVARADAQFNVAWQDFLQRTAQRYFDLLNAIDALRFAEAEEKALQRQYEQAEQRFEVGLSAVTDFLEAQASRDAARARTIVSENNLEDAREGIRELTGTMFESFKPLTEDLPLDPPNPVDASEWVDTALQTNPDLTVARDAVSLADTDIRLARAGHYPTLELAANYNRSLNNEFPLRADDQTQIATTTLQNDRWAATVRLNVPIFSGLAVKSQTQRARINRSVANEELDLNQRQVVRQTENAFRAVMAGIRQVEAFQQALVSADSALEATNAGFEVGTRTIVDVLLAEQRFFQAQRDYSQARHQLILDRLGLRRAAGTITPQDLERANELLEGPERG